MRLEIFFKIGSAKFPRGGGGAGPFLARSLLRESGPAALDTFRFERSLAIPKVEISMSGIEGYLQFTLSGNRFNRDAVPLRSLL